MMGAILVVGENSTLRSRTASILIALGYRVIEAESGLRAIDLLRRRRNISMVIMDLLMSDISAVELIGSIRIVGVFLPVVVVAHCDNDPGLEKAIESGAREYLTYPVSSLRLKVMLGNVVLMNTYEREIHYMRRASEDHLTFDDLSASSIAMRHVLAIAKPLKRSDKNMLIEGEKGTGRETFARIMHRENGCGGHFTRVQCVSFADEKIGHRIWTGDMAEIAFSAKGGTLCLCDVDVLDPIQQRRLCNYLKERDVKGHPHEYRLVALSASRLSDLVQDHAFDAELFALLSQSYIRIPPLRERREDVPDIAQRILNHLIVESGHSYVHGIQGSAMALFMQYDWPGNITELENMLFRSMLTSKGPLLTIADFPHLVCSQSVDAMINGSGDRNLCNSFYRENGHIKSLPQVETELIEEALKRYQGHMSEVARRLKIGRSTLYRKLEVEDINLLEGRDA